MSLIQQCDIIQILQERTRLLKRPEPRRMDGVQELIYPWPGADGEDIMLTVHQSDGQQEPFHRRDYFFFNYTYCGQYDVISQKYDNRITIREGEVYAGQPFVAHAMCAHDDDETIIIGVLIRRELFHHTFLPMLSSNNRLFHFFLDPVARCFSDEYIHFSTEGDPNIRTLLEMMMAEYAHPQSDSQAVLRSLTLAFLLQTVRQYVRNYPEPECTCLSEQIVRYMSEHSDSVSLKDLSTRFSYHPNYISTLLRRETRRSFSEILLKLRMERAAMLIDGTHLPLSEIASMLGYSNSSNFFKAFRAYYHRSPRARLGESMPLGREA